MDKVFIPYNFSLNRDVVCVPIKAFKMRKTMDSGGDARVQACVDPNYASSTLHWN